MDIGLIMCTNQINFQQTWWGTTNINCQCGFNSKLDSEIPVKPSIPASFLSSTQAHKQMCKFSKLKRGQWEMSSPKNVEFTKRFLFFLARKWWPKSEVEIVGPYISGWFVECISDVKKFPFQVLKKNYFQRSGTSILQIWLTNNIEDILQIRLKYEVNWSTSAWDKCIGLNSEMVAVQWTFPFL